MRKHFITLVAVLLGMALNAQVSVWDGTTMPWTHGSGTQEDPYLIENAQNMAYLAQQVNAPDTYNSYGHDVFTDVYFRLTTDLDLGGANSYLWTPVGRTTPRFSTWFCGHFDGDGHKIQNMLIDYTESTTSYGLFGNARYGSITDILLAANCKVDLRFGNQYEAIFVGGVLGCGINICLENCANRGLVKSHGGELNWGLYCGGLFGQVDSGTITNCHNRGDVYSREWDDFGSHAPAGIVAQAIDCTIVGCSNSGNITCVKFYYGMHAGGVSSGGIVGNANGTTSVEQCYNTGKLITTETDASNMSLSSGGIVGISGGSVTLSIKNCYNVADVSVIKIPENKEDYAGGILGGTQIDYNDSPNITIDNCYAVGAIEADTVGGIIAKFGVMPAYKGLVVSNSYYVNSIVSNNDYGTAVSEDYLKSEDFVNALNVDGIVFAMDLNNENNGYPVFADRDPLGVDENVVSGEISVFPNPSHGIINIKAENIVHISVYNILGNKLFESAANGDSFEYDFSTLDAGIYFIKVKTTGKEFVEKIVMGTCF